MAKYFKQDLSKDREQVAKPPMGPLLGGRPAKRAPIVSVFRAQDRIVTTSRRVLLRQGVQGADNWLVPNTDPTVANTHPLNDGARIVARSRVDLTPGCFGRVRVLAALSGQTQTAGATPDATGAQGGVLVEAAYTDAAAITLSPDFDVQIPPSGLEFGGAPTAAESQWKSLWCGYIDMMRPEILDSMADINQWTLPAAVTLTVSHTEGARVVDLVAYELPLIEAMEADDTSNRWCSHSFGSGEPGGPGPNLQYPMQRLSETGADGDPRGGSWHMQDVANAQALRLGPCLIHWTSWDEDAEAVRTTEGDAVAINSATFQCLHNTSLTAYDEANEGFSLASGAYARTRQWTDPVGMSQTGVIPVRLRVYAATGDGSTPGVVRLQSGPYQWVDCVIPASTTYAWHDAFGFARVGRGPGQAAVAQIFVRRTAGASTINVRAVSLHYSGLYTPVI